MNIMVFTYKECYNDPVNTVLNRIADLYEDGKMLRSKDFSLFIISDVPYLLPFGQGIADLKRGVQINSTGVYLWNLLESEHTEEELLSHYAAHYEIPESELPQARTDMQHFLRLLDCYGILNHTKISADSDLAALPELYSVTNRYSGSPFLHENNPAESTWLTRAALSEIIPHVNSPITHQNIVQRYLSVGGLTLLLRGPEEAFSSEFDAFEIFPDCHSASTDIAQGHTLPPARADVPRDNSLHADQTVIIEEHLSHQRPESRILLQTPELVVMESTSLFIFLFPNTPGIHEAHLTKDGRRALYYCMCPPYTDSFRLDLFHAIRHSFLYLAQLHGMIVLHSASLLYQNRAWLFSGHSGAGKSTHTNLWKELYGVLLINGDLNLLSVEGGQPVVHGLPWCGTSGIADTHSYPLGGIFLVKKSLQNYAEIPDCSHAQLLVAQRLISPGWTEALMRTNLRLVASITPHILVCRLYCTKSPEAAGVAKQAVDAYLADSLTDT